jgi:hypothetical protein
MFFPPKKPYLPENTDAVPTNRTGPHRLCFGEIWINIYSIETGNPSKRGTFMRRFPGLAAVMIAGIFMVGAAPAAFPASDNTSTKPKFDHKTLGKDAKDCVKCHKTLPKGKEVPAGKTPPAVKK